MSKFFRTLSAVVVTLASFAAHAGTGAQVLVEGMTCTGCANSVKESFLKHTEVKTVEVNVKKGQVTITFQENKTMTDDQIRDAVKDAGYKVTKITAPKAG